jgi:excisionase family DNA binding protein
MGKEDLLAISVEEARQRLGVSRTLLYQAVQTGQVPSLRIGRRILIPISALNSVLANATRANQKSKEDHRRIDK